MVFWLLKLEEVTSFDETMENSVALTLITVIEKSKKRPRKWRFSLGIEHLLKCPKYHKYAKSTMAACSLQIGFNEVNFAYEDFDCSSV